MELLAFAAAAADPSSAPQADGAAVFGCDESLWTQQNLVAPSGSTGGRGQNLPPLRLTFRLGEEARRR